MQRTAASHAPPRRARLSGWTIAALVPLALAGLSCRDTFPTAPTTVAQVIVSPRGPRLIVGDTVRLSAAAVDRNYTGINGVHPAWTSSAASIASVDESGLVTAHAEGTARITAEVQGHSDTTTVTVLPIPVDSVAVAPATATIILGLSRQLSATTFDRHHNILTGRAVTWQTDNPSVATVSPEGVVTGQGVGSTTVRATVEGKMGSATIVVVPVPVKQVVVTPNPAQVQQGSTVQLSVATLDSAGHALTGRAVTFQSLNTGVATVSPTGLVTGVAAGATTIRVASEGIVTDVPLTVAVPVIALSTTTASFSAKARTTNPAAQTVAVTNAGAFTLSGLSASVTYAAGQPTGWLSATLNTTTAPATLTLQPTTGMLDPGTYNATVTVASSQPGVQSRTVAVTFTVLPYPIIGLSNRSPQFAAQANGVLPAAQSIAITNVGTGNLAGLAFATTYGAGASNWLTVTPSGTTAPATLTLQPNTTALAVGTYTARVVVSSTADATVVPDTVNVTYVVAQGPIIGLSRTTVTSSVQAFQVKHDTQTVSVTNGGGGTLSGLSASVSYGSGSGWLAASINPTTAPATLTLDFNASSLAAGTYTATVTVASTVVGVQSQAIAVTFTVTAQPVIALSATTAADTATRGGALPGSRTVSVTNSGGGTLSGLSAASDQGWLTASLNTTTAPATLTLTPNTTNLAAGTYTATVTVSSSVPGVASRTVTFTYVVQQPQIALSPGSLAFGTVTRGFTSTDGVSVTNAGQGTLSGLSASSNVSWLGASLNTTTAPATLTLTTNTTNLAAGSYTGTVTVSSSLPGVTPQTVTVTVTVLQPQIGLSMSNVTINVRKGYNPGANTTINVSNTGQGTLNGLSVSGGASWVTPSLASATAPTTLTLVYSTSALNVGTYTTSVTVSSSVPGVTAKSVTVTVNVDWSYANDIAPLLSGCTGCHQASETDAAYSANFTVYSQIVNAATHTSTACDGRIRIVANDTINSVMYDKLAHATPQCGGHMPGSTTFWSASDLQKMREWILRGAPNN